MSMTAATPRRPSPVSTTGDTAAADGDDDITGAHELIDNVQLHDALGDRRGDDTAVAASGVLNEDEAFFLGDLLGLFLRIEAADRLRRVLEAGVLRQRRPASRRWRILLHAAALQLLLNGLLQVVADIALRHGAALGERHERRSAALAGGELHCQVDHADLRAVAVADDDFCSPSRRDQRSGGRCCGQVRAAARGSCQEHFPESDNNSFSHCFDPLLQRGVHHSLDGVHTVFGFLELAGLVTEEHVVGDFHRLKAELLVDILAHGRLTVVEGGQAVLENRGGFRHRHEFLC